MKGRTPKPTAIHALNGNPSKLPKDARSAEPQPDPSMPDRPKGLSPAARKAWDRLAPEMHRIGILTRLDGDQLESYAHLYALTADCWKQSKRDGPVVMIAGKPSRNPYVAEAMKAEELLRKLRADMGLSPVSRTRIKAEQPPEEDDLESYLKLTY